MADEDPFASFDPLASDLDAFEADVDEAAVQELLQDATDCISAVDRFTMGEIAGQYFVKFFDSALKPLI